MKFKNNNKGFSIVMAMGIVVFVSLAAIYLLEFIVPFSRSVKGVENSSASYYQANSGIEESLWYIGQNGIGDENSKSFSQSGDQRTYSYDIVANGAQIPLSGEGNSEYDSNWNTISKGNPIQLEVGDSIVSSWVSGGGVEFDIRIPNTTGELRYSLGNGSNQVLNWQISSPENTLNSDNSAVTATEINGSSTIYLGTRWGRDTKNSPPERFRDFYSANCSSGPCVLKLTLISDLISNTGNIVIPYLEYQIDFGTSAVPLRFVQIESSGKSSGFRKDLKVKVPQLTVGEAFDYTVLQ